MARLEPGFNLPGIMSGPSQREVPNYAAFAGIYDRVMDHIDYRGWARFILAVFQEFSGKAPESILDLGCGSGQLLRHFYQLTRRRFRHKLDLAGLDSCPEMVETARAACAGQALIYQGDMVYPETVLPNESFDLITSTHDCVNYILEAGQVGRHFAATRRLMRPGGLFLVDFTTEANILEYFAGRKKKYRVRRVKMEWSNEYDPGTRVISSRLEIDYPGKKEKLVESHQLKYYTPRELIGWARAAGLEFLESFGDYDWQPIHDRETNLGILVLRRPYPGGNGR